MTIRAFDIRECQVHGRQHFHLGQCVSCRKDKPVYKPSHVNSGLISVPYYARRGLPLSPTQKRVVLAYAQGLSMESIAEVARVSRQSISSSLARALCKLGLPDRQHLVDHVRSGGGL